MKIEVRSVFGSLIYVGEHVNIREALEQAVSVGVEMQYANLEKTNLENANLAGANLQGANLAGANLEGANLEGANLKGAKLEGASLRGANLTRAKLDGTLLEQSKAPTRTSVLERELEAEKAAHTKLKERYVLEARSLSREIEALKQSLTAERARNISQSIELSQKRSQTLLTTPEVLKVLERVTMLEAALHAIAKLAEREASK